MMNKAPAPTLVVPLEKTDFMDATIIYNGSSCGGPNVILGVEGTIGIGIAEFDVNLSIGNNQDCQSIQKVTIKQMPSTSWIYFFIIVMGGSVVLAILHQWGFINIGF